MSVSKSILNNSYKPGDKVAFKDNYTGYFDNFKDITLTISNVIYCPMDGCRVIIEELKDVEMHLINPIWLKRV